MGRLLRVPGTTSRKGVAELRQMTLDITRVKSKSRDEAKEVRKVLHSGAPTEEIEERVKSSTSYKSKGHMVTVLKTQIAPRTIRRTYDNLRWDGVSINSELPPKTYRIVLVVISEEEREIAGHLVVKGDVVNVEDFDLDGPQVRRLRSLPHVPV